MTGGNHSDTGREVFVQYSRLQNTTTNTAGLTIETLA